MRRQSRAAPLLSAAKPWSCAGILYGYVRLARGGKRMDGGAGICFCSTGLSRADGRRREERISNIAVSAGGDHFVSSEVREYMSQSTMYPALGGQGQGQGNRCGKKETGKRSQGQNNDNKTPTGGGGVWASHHVSPAPPMADTGLIFSSFLLCPRFGPEMCVGFRPLPRSQESGSAEAAFPVP